MSHAKELRRLIQLIEDVAPQAPLNPKLAQYIERFPEEVSNNINTLMAANIAQAEDGALFQWCIARLPDGRFITGISVRNAQEWGLQVVKQGDSDDLTQRR